MKKIPSVLYVFVMLVKHQEQNIDFIVEDPFLVLKWIFPSDLAFLHTRKNQAIL